jgi:hypothetical protein
MGAEGSKEAEAEAGRQKDDDDDDDAGGQAAGGAPWR